MPQPGTILRVLSIESVLIPRLLVARCQTLSGQARAGAGLLTPSGALVCPVSASAGADGSPADHVALCLPPSEAAEALRGGDLLKSLS